MNHFHRRRFREARQYLQKLGLELWGLQALRMQWHWAGHTARHAEEIPLMRVLQYRGRKWQDTHYRVSGGKMHGRSCRGLYRQWEDEIYYFSMLHNKVREEWGAELTKESWQDKAADFLLWRLRPMKQRRAHVPQSLLRVH